MPTRAPHHSAPSTAEPRVVHRHHGAPRCLSQTARMELLSAIPAFALLGEGVRKDMAKRLHEEEFTSGQAVVTEGEIGDCLYIIAHGEAEVTVKSPSGPLLLSTLESGEMFGELALLSEARKRQATVTALTPLCVLSLSSQTFHRLLSEHPQARARLELAAEAMTLTRFLKQASPFAKLPSNRLEWLTERLVRQKVHTGEDIIRQGETGESCYLLRAGKVQVVTQDGETERRLATLNPGTLFGEAALLTNAPRNATVRALEPCELLVLHRADLLEAMQAHADVSGQMVQLLQMRDRPRQVPDVISQQRVSADGATITILKDPHRNAYYRLSAEGWFLWQRLDGKHSLRDLALDYMTEYKAFAPEAIAEILGGLAGAGFIQTSHLHDDLAQQNQTRVPLWQQVERLARRVLEWQVTLDHTDEAVTRAYRAGPFLLFTRWARLILLPVMLFGFAIFLEDAYLGGPTHTLPAGRLLWLMIPIYAVTILFHEAGHAFAAKYCGREVPRLGIGWDWILPVAFVDTSDMWLANRRQRIAVTIAGPASNLLLGGLAALATHRVGSLWLQTLLWQFAFVNYVTVLINLNPLLEYDGYYVLMDFFERPNLRPHALGWIGAEMLPALKTREKWKGHWLEVIYGFSSLVYVIGTAILAGVAYRHYFQDWIHNLLPPHLAYVAAWLAWGFGGLALALCLLLAAGEIRGHANQHTAKKSA